MNRNEKDTLKTESTAPGPDTKVNKDVIKTDASPTDVAKSDANNEKQAQKKVDAKDKLVADYEAAEADKKAKAAAGKSVEAKGETKSAEVFVSKKKGLTHEQLKTMQAEGPKRVINLSNDAPVEVPPVTE